MFFLLGLSPKGHNLQEIIEPQIFLRKKEASRNGRNAAGKTDR